MPQGVPAGARCIPFLLRAGGPAVSTRRCALHTPKPLYGHFRARAGGPRIDIKTAIDQDGDLLVMGEIESRFADMNGIAYYRLGFDGDRINRIDITRSDDRMTVTKFHALQHN